MGCGTGESSIDVARAASAGSVLGVDLSARMLDLARWRSQDAGATNVEFLQADAQVHPFAAEAFDLAVSRFGAMFFNDPAAAFANIGRAVRPGGRLAMLSWQELARNEWLVAIRTALAAGRALPTPPPNAPGPFGLSEPDGVRRILAEAGFAGIEIETVEEPLRFGADAEDAWAFVRTLGIVRGLTGGLDDEIKAHALDALQAVLAEHETAEGVLFGAAAWLISARRTSQQ